VFESSIWNITDHRLELLRGSQPDSSLHKKWSSTDNIVMWLKPTLEAYAMIGVDVTDLAVNPVHVSGVL
jgi:hypothetical protein